MTKSSGAKSIWFDVNEKQKRILDGSITVYSEHYFYYIFEWRKTHTRLILNVDSKIYFN